MEKFEITLSLEGTEESVRALEEHLRMNVLPEAYEIENPSIRWKLFRREVQGFCGEDVAGCAADYGYDELSPEEIENVLDLMEKRFDANIGMSWDVIEIWINDVIQQRRSH